jgi:hypothetical protein
METSCNCALDDETSGQLAQLCSALNWERERSGRSIHLFSSDATQVQRLYAALSLLLSAEAAVRRLMATAKSQREVVLELTHYVSKFRKEAFDSWNRREFRASEAFSRTLTILVAAEIGLRRNDNVNAVTNSS